MFDLRKIQRQIHSHTRDDEYQILRITLKIRAEEIEEMIREGSTRAELKDSFNKLFGESPAPDSLGYKLKKVFDDGVDEHFGPLTPEEINAANEANATTTSDTSEAEKDTTASAAENSEDK